MLTDSTTAAAMPTPLFRPIEAAPLGRDVDRATALEKTDASRSENEVRKTFESVLGEMLFGQLLKGMRKTLGKPAYFYGGRAEEVFTQQLDQVLAEKISDASAEQFVAPMYELFMMERQ
jgi:aminopeptidase N